MASEIEGGGRGGVPTVSDFLTVGLSHAIFARRNHAIDSNRADVLCPRQNQVQAPHALARAHVQVKVTTHGQQSVERNTTMLTYKLPKRIAHLTHRGNYQLQCWNALPFPHAQFPSPVPFPLPSGEN